MITYLRGRWYVLKQWSIKLVHGIFGCPAKHVSGDERLGICTRCLRRRYGSDDIRAIFEAIDRHNL